LKHSGGSESSGYNAGIKSRLSATSLIFIDNNNNLRQRRKWTGNYPAMVEKNFVQKFRLSIVSLILCISSRALSLCRCAAGKSDTVESSVTSYFTRLHAITGDRQPGPCRSSKKARSKGANDEDGRNGVGRKDRERGQGGRRSREHLTRRRELVNPVPRCRINANSSELPYFFAIHSARKSWLKSSSRGFPSARMSGSCRPPSGSDAGRVTRADGRLNADNRGPLMLIDEIAVIGNFDAVNSPAAARKRSL